MEESEKRRERLKAMRMEASESTGDGGHSDVGNSRVSQNLLNPLTENCGTEQVVDSYATRPRFDYYTDPMAAFSSNKRKSKVSNQNSQDSFTPPRPRNPEMIPSPARQVQTNYSPDQGMYHARGPYHSPSPYGSPIGMASPFGTHQGTPEVWNGPNERSPAHQVQTNYSPDQGMYQARVPYHSSGSYGSPMGMASPFGTHHGTPGVWNGSTSAGTPNYYRPLNLSGVGNFYSRGFSGQGGSPNLNSGGRGHWFGSCPTSGSGRGGSPTPNSGRGRGRRSGNNMQSGLGRGGNRGFSSYNNISAELRPDLYFDKSMVEDPWKLLKPVIWRTKNVPGKSLMSTPDSLKSSHPNSLGMKKPRIAEASNKSSSQPSLAEYLAAAFNEAANNERSCKQ